MKRDIEQYAKDFLQPDYAFEHILKKYRYQNIVAFLEKYCPQHILEIGCATQSLFDYYHDFKTWVVVEPGEFFCNEVKKSEFFNPKKIQIVQGLVEEKIDILKKYSFDFIILCGVLHEIKNQNEVLKSIYKLCNEKTLIHVLTSNNESFHLLWAQKSGLIKSNVELTETGKRFQRFSTFNLKSLKEIVEKNGFEVLEKGSFFIKPFNHEKMQYLIQNDILNELLLNGLNNLTDYFPNNGAEIFCLCRKCFNENNNEK